MEGFKVKKAFDRIGRVCTEGGREVKMDGKKHMKAIIKL